MAAPLDSSQLWSRSYQPGNDTSQDGGSRSEKEEYVETLSYYLMGIGGSTTCCLGTIANALSIAVLTRRSMRSSTYTYLTALAVCDTLVLFLTLIIIINDTNPPDSPPPDKQLHAILFPFVHPLAVMFQVTSIWLTLAFTVDRYIMICHPFRAETMCRRSRARKVIICLYISGLIFNIPRFLEYKTQLITYPIDNSSQATLYFIATTPLGDSVLFRELIHSWMYLLFICGIPFLMMVILNAFLIRAVHLSRQKGKEINPKEKHRNDTTIMLIGVIVIFLICQGPALVSRMIYAFDYKSSLTEAVITLNEVANFFVYLNSAINIVPYYLFGRKFRSEFWRIFCACCFDKDELRRINRSYSVSVDQRHMSQYNVIEMNGVTQNSYPVLCGDHGSSYRSNNHTYNDNRCDITTKGSETCLLHSDTNGSVVVPLIHGMYHSLSCHMLGSSRDTCKDAAKQNGSQIISPAEPPPSQNLCVSSRGNVQYSSITASSCLRGIEGSAV